MWILPFLYLLFSNFALDTPEKQKVIHIVIHICEQLLDFLRGKTVFSRG